MASSEIGKYCYCDIWEKDPNHFESQGIPRGYCGICDGCGAPGHTRHYPGPVPVTGAWCDDCYRRLPTIPFWMKIWNGAVLLFILGFIAVVVMLLR